MTLGIELLQPLINGTRSSDITDIITNMTGGDTGIRSLSGFQAGRVLDIGPSEKVGAAFAAAMTAAINS